MLVEIVAENVHDVMSVLEVLDSKGIRTEIKEGSGAGDLRIICLEGFGSNGNSPDSITRQLKQQRCVKRISKIKVGFKLGAALTPNQLQVVYEKN